MLYRRSVCWCSTRVLKLVSGLFGLLAFAFFGLLAFALVL